MKTQRGKTRTPQSSAKAGHAGVLAKKMKKRTSNKNNRIKVGPRKTVSQHGSNIVGCKIKHGWKEDNGLTTECNGIILAQMTVCPSLYLIKYDGFDHVYGIELYKDERVLALEVFPDRVASTRISDVHLEGMIGRPVEHMFETEDGSKNEWNRGMVLAKAPIIDPWFYIAYENDPVLHMYQLLDDYKRGDLRIMPDSTPAEWEIEEVAKSVYFIKFDDDFHIYVYSLVKRP